MRDRKGVDLEGRGSGEELGGVWGRGTVTRTYGMKKLLFSKNGGKR